VTVSLAAGVLLSLPSLLGRDQVATVPVGGDDSSALHGAGGLIADLSGL